MAGKRLLDAALLFNATRSIGRQHLRLRSEQLEAWNKTSTVARAIKNQTDRVTLTAQAATALARRLSEDESPLPTSTFTQTRKTEPVDPVPSNESVDHSGADFNSKEGLQQDHHYKRSEQNATQEPARESDLHVAQKQPSRYPTADGSIPPTHAPVGIGNGSEGLDMDGERAAVPPIKDPLVQEQQSRSGSLAPESSGSSTIPDPKAGAPDGIPTAEAVPEQESVPEEINTDVFHSPRVSKLLGQKGKSGQTQQDAGSRGSHKASIVSNEEAEVSGSSKASVLSASQTPEEVSGDEDVHNLASDIANDAETSPDPEIEPSTQHPYQMHESRVPSSRMGRLWQYSGLATSMAFGAVGETFRRATGGGNTGGSLMLSAGNMERLVAKLSKMRGAALKLGQMISFQDSKMLPAPIQEVLQRVQDNADYMPSSQRNSVLASNLGTDWQSLFSSFDDKPIAAASIGQVHRATLASSGQEVAIKIQYPGVSTSISSDLNNLSILLTASRLLPTGLFLDKTIANARTELAWECDYLREAECQSRFRSLLADETDVFTVPAIIKEASGPQILTAEMMSGVGVTKPSLRLTQRQRDWIGTQILRLCLRELTEFNFMQTDPNWTNFLFNAPQRRIELLDFGAAREFPDRFVDPYVELLVAAAADDTETVKALSVRLGYLTGRESHTMLEAHVRSVLTLAEPFRAGRSVEEVYDFRDQTITDRVRALIPVMIRERLAPPPEETYSLHRKLSGAFLLLARLGSRVKCREMFVESIDRWREKRKKKSRVSA